VVLPGLLLGTSRVTPAAAGSLVAKGKPHAVTVATDQTVEMTAKASGETIVVKPAADIIEVVTDRYVHVSKGKKSFQAKGDTFLCTRAGGCECAAGESSVLHLPPTLLGPGKITIRLVPGTSISLTGHAVEELCDKLDRCLLGTWNADLSAYLASLGMQVTSLSGIEKYTFTKKGTYADASNYTINALDVRTPGIISSR
jgi:hypothetical protein